MPARLMMVAAVPSTAIAANVPSSTRGSVNSGRRALLGWRRKSAMTSTTIATSSASAPSSVRSARVARSRRSYTVTRRTPAGSCARTLSRARRAARMSGPRLAFRFAITIPPTAGQVPAKSLRPLGITIAFRTRATSRTSTGSRAAVGAPVVFGPANDTLAGAAGRGSASSSARLAAGRAARRGRTAASTSENARPRARSSAASTSTSASSAGLRRRRPRRRPGWTRASGGRRPPAVGAAPAAADRASDCRAYWNTQPVLEASGPTSIRTVGGSLRRARATRSRIASRPAGRTDSEANTTST